MATTRTRPRSPAADPSHDDVRHLHRHATNHDSFEDTRPTMAVQPVDHVWATGLNAEPFGRGSDVSRQSKIIGMQQRFGNRSVQRYVQRAAVQREESGSAKAETAPTEAPAPPVAAAPTGGTAGAGKSATITLKAYYEDVPGQAKDKVQTAKGKDVLWLGLEMDSDYPLMDNKRIDQLGLAAGAPMVIDKYPAPLSVGDNPVGRGGIAAQLMYASDLSQSFDVQVTGHKGNAWRAKVAAKELIAKRARQFGDVDALAKEAEEALASEYPGAKVSIKTLPNKVMDAGRSKFHYKVRGNSTISMDVQAVPVGDRQVTVSGSQTKGKTTDNEESQRTKSEGEKLDIKKEVKDTERTKQTSTESLTVNYNKAVVKTLEDYVDKSTKIHSELVSDLTNKVVTDSEYHGKDNWHQDAQSKTVVENYTKHVEAGQKDKENFASKASRWLGGIKKVLDFPLSWIPGRLGKIGRRLSKWWIGPALDAGKWVADQFAVKGKVDYTDETINKTTTTKVDPTGGGRDVDVTRHDVQETTRNLKEKLHSATYEEWKHHMKEITTTAEEYKSLKTSEFTGATDKTHTEDYSKTGKRDETEASKRQRTTENQSTTTNFTSTIQWKFTRPVVTATVVDGDAEVKNTPFQPDAAEKAGKV